MGKDRHGANGKPIVLKVPVGTQIFRRGSRNADPRLHFARREIRAGGGWQWRFRQRAFQILPQPLRPPWAPSIRPEIGQYEIHGHRHHDAELRMQRARERIVGDLRFGG